MAEISIVKFGEVPQPMLDKILEVIDECYKLLGEPMSDFIDLHIFEKAEEETFFATHDALQGRPKISIFLDRFQELPELVRLAGIRRQVAHSILHGSPDFYLIRFPEKFREAMKKYSLPLEYMSKLLYGIGMAAKEYEVTNLLYRKKFIEDQITYAKYMLELSSEDILSWEIASRNKLEKALHLISLVRDISCAVPLLKDEKFGFKIKELIEARLAPIIPDCRSRVYKIVFERFFLGSNTMENIEMLTEALVEEIIEPELGGQATLSS